VPQRDEESLIDEMREAIRGDRERAAARSGRIPILEHEREHEEPAPAAEPQKPLLRRLLGR
jgi:hypothetical protein